jgi:hypothetical protein
VPPLAAIQSGTDETHENYETATVLASRFFALLPMTEWMGLVGCKHGVESLHIRNGFIKQKIQGLVAGHGAESLHIRNDAVDKRSDSSFGCGAHYPVILGVPLVEVCFRAEPSRPPVAIPPLAAPPPNPSPRFLFPSLSPLAL